MWSPREPQEQRERKLLDKERLPNWLIRFYPPPFISLSTDYLNMMAFIFKWFEAKLDKHVIDTKVY